MQTATQTNLTASPIYMRPIPGMKVGSLLSVREQALNCFCDYIQEISGKTIHNEEYALIAQMVKFKTVRRRQYILQEGDVCRYFSFVVSGALRMYSVNERGQESIVSLGLENDWITDRESITLQTPSIYNIEATENTEIIQITTSQFETLNQIVPAVNEMSRVQNKQMAIKTQKRIHAAISMTAEERYYDLQASHPEYFQRFSQNMMASYLGIKPETLSRVRNR